MTIRYTIRSNTVYARGSRIQSGESKTDVKTYDCNICEAKWMLNENSLIFKIKADRFLRNMVRAIVGTLILVGERRLSPKKIKGVQFGIMSPEDAIEKIDAGASLIQLYTGFVYQGPLLVKRINNAILKKYN